MSTAADGDVIVKSTCTLYWGAIDDDPEPTEDVYLSQTDDPLAKRYRCCEQI